MSMSLSRIALIAGCCTALLPGCGPAPWPEAAAAEPVDPLPPLRIEAQVRPPPPPPAPRVRTPELIVDKVTDAGIGAAVSAELARDAQLATAPVEVDSVGGRVALRGVAPDAAARERAGEIAASVDGVRTVENVLELASARGATR